VEGGSNATTVLEAITATATTVRSTASIKTNSPEAVTRWRAATAAAKATRTAPEAATAIIATAAGVQLQQLLLYSTQLKQLHQKQKQQPQQQQLH
jgi:hypothetical protein